MLQAYSTDITVGANAAIPFNNVSLVKGRTAVLSAPSSIQLNKAGIYYITVNGSITPDADGDVSIQLTKNGILQPQAISTGTGATGSPTALAFSTFVQVSENNTCACYSSPTVINILNSSAGTFSNVNVTVSKIC
jgi:hypothetical protein